MTVQTITVLRKSLDSPDRVKNFSNGKAEIVNLEDVTIGRLSLRPGWKWSLDVKPLAKTESCQEQHIMYVITGRLMVRMDDGTEIALHPGDSAAIPPGHDAWVLGDEPVVAVDFGGMKEYSKQAEPAIPDPETGILYDYD